MGIALYKEGDSHTIRGVVCEMQVFRNASLDSALKAGWYLDPNDIGGKKAPTKEEADTNNSGKLSSDEVRAAAKEAGIEGHDTKRIKTLKAELGYDSEED